MLEPYGLAIQLRESIVSQGPTQTDAQTHFEQSIADTLDTARQKARDKKHSKGFRTARENLEDLIDRGSFVEYGQLAVAAQRDRRDPESLRIDTAADGVITGTATINSELRGSSHSNVALAIYDYSVLAGTQGFFHHQKLDRIFEVAERDRLPFIMYTEGGGGRPGDTDVKVNIAGLNSTSFSRWAGLTGKVPRITVNNGYCFAGNAALFGAGDIRIATKKSSIGRAGPAMIEGGGLGVFHPDEIGPVNTLCSAGAIDLLAEDEAHATALAKWVLGYAQGSTAPTPAADQQILRTILPDNRRMAYDVRRVMDVLFDAQSVVELRPVYGRAVVTALARVEGHAVAVIASDCRHLGGAIDVDAARKAGEMMELAKRWKLPIVSLVDTPGFMVGPESEAMGAAKVMPELFNTAASVDTPWVGIFLRRGYGLGAMALVGGSFEFPTITASWPQGEFGGMGLEGAVRLGFKKELAALPEGEARDTLFEKLLAEMYEKGRATEAAAYLEIDLVIDPSESRSVILRGIKKR